MLGRDAGLSLIGIKTESNGNGNIYRDSNIGSGAYRMADNDREGVNFLTINNNNMKSIANFLKSEEKRVIDWVISKEPSFIKSTREILDITTGLLDWIKSPQGKTVEQIAEELVPKSAIWAVEGTAIVIDLAADLTAVSNPKNWQAIAERIGGELLFLAQGGKITSVSEGIAEFQHIFLG